MNQNKSKMKNLQLTDAEWEIMKALWELSPSTVQEISDALAESRQWHPKTVRTMLSRMVKKNLISQHKEDGVYRYQPLYKKEDYISQASESFLDKVFDGALAPMVAHFARQRSLSDEEKEELYRILRDDD